MNNLKYRVLFISSQPTQNFKPLQILAQYPNLEIIIAFCSLPSGKVTQNLEEINKNCFDIPMLEGYPWVYVPNRSPLPDSRSAWRFINPSLVTLVPKFDCCVVYGHAYVSFWLAIAIAKLTRKPLLLSTDATYLEPSSGSNWKVSFKRRLLPYLYNHISDAVLVPSTASKRFIHSLGVSEDRIFITPYVVDNLTISTTAQKTDRNQIRSEWQIPVDAVVVSFCAKFIPRKRPQDLVKAFARANVPNSYLILIGDGPLRDSLEAEVNQLKIAEQVRFLGLVNYSRLPEVYVSSDLLVHSAEWEPYGLPVNEAMVCGVPVVVSDRVGAGYDLVQEGITGFTYPSGDVDALAFILQKTLSDRQALKQMGKAAIERMKTWSSRENAEGTVQAIEKAITWKQGARLP
ncbi:MAG: glycosyltransferase family 4 protein [Nostoc sp.]|uniref:glycosyltransferase family 4 protein n=1 Tax=Nostoc sp. TaxID=1180 RepID=UPI002FF36276